MICIDAGLRVRHNTMHLSYFSHRVSNVKLTCAVYIVYAFNTNVRSIYVNSIHVIFYFSFSFRFYWLVKFENAHFNRIRFERKQNTIKFKWNFPLYFLIDFSFYTTVTVLAVLSAYIGTFWSAFCTVRGEVAQNYFLIVESVAKII